MKKRKFLFIILGVLAVAFLADFYVGRRQEAFIKEKEARKKELEKLAFFMIFPDIHYVKDVKPEKYKAVIKVENVSDEPVYVTPPQVKAYVQTGTFWTEVPVKDLGEGNQQVLKLDPEPGGSSYTRVRSYDKAVPMEDIGSGQGQDEGQQIGAEPKYQFPVMLTIARGIKYTRYLMPLYMHVRFHISLFVLPESAFKEEEVVERYTDVYVYLKPFFVTDEEVLKNLDFEKVPTFIPMPPH